MECKIAELEDALVILLVAALIFGILGTRWLHAPGGLGLAGLACAAGCCLCLMLAVIGLREMTASKTNCHQGSSDRSCSFARCTLRNG